VVASAFAYTSVRALKDSDHELVVVFYFPLISLPMIAPFSIETGVWPQGTDWGFVLAIGICTFLAQLFMTQSYQKDRAQDVAIYNFLGIFFALGIGYLFFEENFSLLSYVGMALVLFSVYLVTRVRPKAMESFQKR
jgi:drug/metabolite transporter (DMT)-like permease